MILGLALMLAGVAVEEKTASAQAPTLQPMRKARDPDLAVREELAAARVARTLAAYDLFMARHPSHPLAKVACKERAALAKKAGNAR